MSSRVSHFEPEQAAQIVASCGGSAKTCGNVKALVLALGSRHVSRDGRSIVWYSPCSRCGGRGAVYWGTCFRCGGVDAMRRECEKAAIAPIWRDLCAIAEGKPAPSVVSDARRNAAACAKFAAEDAAAREWAVSHGHDDLVDGGDWRAGVWNSARDVCRRASKGTEPTEKQRNLLRDAGAATLTGGVR